MQTSLEEAFLRLTSSGTNVIFVCNRAWRTEHNGEMISNGITPVELDSHVKVYDNDKIYVSMELALQATSGFRGSTKIYQVSLSSSQFECLVQLNCGYVLDCSKLNPNISIASLVGRYFHELEQPTLFRINIIDNAADEFFGRRIRMCIMRYCILNRVTYVGFGDEQESVDNAVLLRARARHYGNQGNYPEGQTAFYGTHPVVIKWLSVLLSTLGYSRNDVYIVHVGEGSMNELGIPSIGYVSNSKYKVTIIDPPWGGYDYWYSETKEIDISGPVEGVRRVIPRWGPRLDVPDWKSFEVTINSTGRVLDFGSGDGLKGKEIVKSGELVQYDPVLGVGKRPKGPFTDIILRHVLHHVFDLRHFFYDLSPLMENGTILWIKEHDCSTSAIAYHLSEMHKEHLHMETNAWKRRYYEGFMSFFDLKEFMIALGYELIQEIPGVGWYQSGWLVFKYTTLVHLPSTPLFSITTGRQISKLPFNYNAKVTKGSLRMSVPAHDLYFTNFSEEEKLTIKDLSIWPVSELTDKGWVEGHRGIYPNINDVFKFIHHIEGPDLFKIQTWRDDLAVGLWSVSNSINPKPREVVDMFLRRYYEHGTSFILLFPRRIQARIQYPDGMSTDNDQVTMGVFTDWVAEPEDFINVNVRVMSLQRLLILCERDEIGRRRWKRSDLETFDMNHPKMHLWFAVTSTDMFDFRFEDIRSQQPQGIKLSGQVLRFWSGSEKSKQYHLRKWVLKKLFPKIKIFPQSTTMDGTMLWKGRRVNVITSGHIINMLLSSGIRVVDWGAYLDTIRNNILIRTNKRIQEAYLSKFKLKIITETYRDLPLAAWHNYFDIFNGIATYVFMSKIFSFPLNLRAVVFMLIGIKKLAIEFPIFYYQYPDAELRNVRR